MKYGSTEIQKVCLTTINIKIFFCVLILFYIILYSYIIQQNHFNNNNRVDINQKK